MHLSPTCALTTTSPQQQVSTTQPPFNVFRTKMLFSLGFGVLLLLCPSVSVSIKTDLIAATAVQVGTDSSARSWSNVQNAVNCDARVAEITTRSNSAGNWMSASKFNANLSANALLTGIEVHTTVSAWDANSGVYDTFWERVQFTFDGVATNPPTVWARIAGSALNNVVVGNASWLAGAKNIWGPSVNENSRFAVQLLPRQGERWSDRLIRVDCVRVAFHFNLIETPAPTPQPTPNPTPAPTPEAGLTLPPGVTPGSTTSTMTTTAPPTETPTETTLFDIAIPTLGVDDTEEPPSGEGSEDAPQVSNGDQTLMYILIGVGGALCVLAAVIAAVVVWKKRRIANLEDPLAFAVNSAAADSPALAAPVYRSSFEIAGEDNDQQSSNVTANFDAADNRRASGIYANFTATASVAMSGPGSEGIVYDKW
jgi:hypothetical protein